MNPAELPLRDGALPPPLIAWWPLAPGWWLVLTGLGMLVGGCLWWGYQRRRTRLRRLALARLQALRADHAQTGDAHALAGQASMLCRQILLALPQGTSLRAVTGEALLEALDSLVPGQQFFTQGAGRALVAAPYDPRSTLDAEAILQGLEQWLNRLPPHAFALRLGDA
ncbi:MAG: DUF4381 domain-containing protein [Gammaproteobacteria bacterium]|nr:DUF4381 domain-containing protein [Gammaproteobacteria bacterium]